jgi:hypothetical protein
MPSSKTRRQKKQRGGNGADDWRKFVMEVHAELKKKNKDAKFGDAMKEASKRRKAKGSRKQSK